MLGSVESLMTRRLVVVDAIPNMRRDCAICGNPCVSFAYTVLEGLVRGTSYVIIGAETKNNLTVYVAALQAAIEMVVRSSEHCCQDVKC
jgi:hypothetical protein